MNGLMHTLISVRVGRRLLREEDGTTHEQESAHVMESATHQSVFPEEAIELLSLRPGDVVVDATAGRGGHSMRILQRADVQLIALDADPTSVAHVQMLSRPYGSRARVLEGNFGHMEKLLAEVGVLAIDKCLFDLGWNRTQLLGGRGFSFVQDEPLIMSYGDIPASGLTAADMLNTLSEEAIANLLFGYGEERYARRIARQIVSQRDTTPFTTTAQLVEAVRAAVPPAYRRGRIHPATRTFQALRIAVNDELTVLEQGLAQAWKLLQPGGRIVVITFHSIEDRIVKHFFKTYAQQGGVLLTKKPILPTQAELHANPSARSAKLRAIQKV